MTLQVLSTHIADAGIEDAEHERQHDGRAAWRCSATSIALSASR
jgi:hypothetical protein